VGSVSSMSTVITVENLGKKYTLRHQQREQYTALRDVITNGVRNFSKKIFSPFTPHSSPLTASQEDFWALKDVSFEVKQGDRIGIIGRNGAGKSTLLKILSRITEPTTGSIRIKGRVASLLEVGTGFHPELTGRENIFLNGAILGMGRAEIKKKFDEIVDFAEIEKFLDTPVKRYSSGMYVRLAFAVAAHLEPEILIVDEVLAVGDAQFQKKCLGKMEDVSAKEGRTVIFVSHNINMIESLCTKTFFINNGSLKGPLTVKEGLLLYIGEFNKKEIAFKDKCLTLVKVKQLNEFIEITAEYNLDNKIKLPSLGFVISDYYGNPITGSNPVIDCQDHLVIPKSQGVVKVVIEYPKLLDGIYRLSLWFGDGSEDFIQAKDCLSFEVVNMVKKRQQPTSDVGHVAAKCYWEFS